MGLLEPITPTHPLSLLKYWELAAAPIHSVFPKTGKPNFLGLQVELETTVSAQLEIVATCPKYLVSNKNK